MAEKNRKLDEDAEQAAAEVEPMGSVAGAMPRDVGSANVKPECEDTAPDHEGGHATLVAGKEAHKADQHIEKVTTPKKH